MKGFVSAVVACSLSMSAMGCGGSKPLPTGAQKAELQGLETSVSRAELAIPIPSALSPSSDPTGDEVRAEMQRRLQDSITDSDCQVSKTGLDGATSGWIDPMNSVSGSLGVTGDKCPIDFKLSLTSQKAGQQNVAITFSAAYSVKDDTYRTLNDVDSVLMTLSFNISGGAAGGTIGAEMKIRAHSQQYGDFSEITKGTGNAGSEGGSFDLTVIDTFAGFEIDREMKASVGVGDEDYTYTVNGDIVSKDEFYSYGPVAVSTGPSPSN